MFKKRIKRGPKHGNLLGIKISSSSNDQLLEEIDLKLKNKERFYIITPNPEIVLMATKDRWLKKAIQKSDFSVPDGIGLAQAYKFLSLENPKNMIIRLPVLLLQGVVVGLATFFNRDWLMDQIQITKGRKLFLDLIKLANEKFLRVYFFGGEYHEAQKAIEVLKDKYKNIVFKTNYNFPNYDLNGQPDTEIDRKLHKKIVGSIKMFEPDLIFVAMTPPKQEKWILRNFFRTRAVGAMAVGGTFNYIAGYAKLPPKIFEKYGLEWLWRFFTERAKGKRISRMKRVFMSFFIFPWTIFLSKLYDKKYKTVYSVVEK